MKGCCERVTVWRRGVKGNRNDFEREIVSVLCNWRSKSERGLSGAGFAEKSVVTVIIPYVPGFAITTGDLIALGEHENEITGDKPFRECDIKAELKNVIVTVQKVSYNLQGHGEHLRVEGI